MAAGTNIGRWSVQANLDAQGFTSGAQRMSQSIQSLKTTLASLAASFASVGTAISLFNTVSDQAGKAEDLAFLNDQLGTTIEWLSQFQTVAGEAGIEAEQFARIMEMFNRNLGQASMNGGNVAEALQRLGFSVEELQAMPFQERITRILIALREMENRSERASIAFQLFGRAGAGALRLASNIEQVADAIGMTNAEMRNLLELDEVLDRASTRWEQLKRSVSSAFGATVTAVHQGGSLPFINAFMQWMNGGPVPMEGPQSSPGGGGGPSVIGGAFAGLGQAFQQGAGAIREFVDRMREFNDAMGRGQRIAEEVRTPLETFQARMQELDALRTMLGDQFNETYARAAARALEQLQQSIADAPGIGGLEADSQEVASIIAAASNPQVDVLELMRVLQQEQLAETQRSREVLDRILEAMQADPSLQGF